MTDSALMSAHILAFKEDDKAYWAQVRRELGQIMEEAEKCRLRDRRVSDE